MYDRTGILLLFFDLPSVTKEDKKEYRHFKKLIKRMGFEQLQESVYIKLVRNIETIMQDKVAIKTAGPIEGSILLLPLRIEQARKLTTIVGKEFNIDSFADDIITI